MVHALRKIVYGTVALATLGVTAAQAAPLSITPTDAVVKSSVEQVQYYYGRRRGYYGGYGAGGAIAAGAALGLLGAGIAAATAAPAYGYGYGYGYPAYGYGYPAYDYGY